MPKQIISPKECLLYASILEKGQLKMAEIKHAKNYRGEFSKMLDSFLLDPDYNFHRVRPLAVFMKERPNCLIFLYKQGDCYYTCIGTKYYRKRIAQNFLEDLAEAHQELIALQGSSSSASNNAVGNSSSNSRLNAATKKLLKEKFQHHNQPFNDVYLQGMKLVDENIDGVRLSLEKAALRAGHINELNEKSGRILDSTYTANSKSLRLKNTARGNVYKFMCMGIFCIGIMVSVTAVAVLFRFHVFDRFFPAVTTPPQIPKEPNSQAASVSSHKEKQDSSKVSSSSRRKKDASLNDQAATLAASASRALSQEEWYDFDDMAEDELEEVLLAAQTLDSDEDGEEYADEEDAEEEESLLRSSTTDNANLDGAFDEELESFLND